MVTYTYKLNINSRHKTLTVLINNVTDEIEFPRWINFFANVNINHGKLGVTIVNHLLQIT